MVRNAAKMVDEQFKYFQENYAVKDRADLLAMVALQAATNNLESKQNSDDGASQEALTSLRDFLRESLS